VIESDRNFYEAKCFKILAQDPNDEMVNQFASLSSYYEDYFQFNLDVIKLKNKKEFYKYRQNYFTLNYFTGKINKYLLLVFYYRIVKNRSPVSNGFPRCFSYKIQSF
jgi:hypothetical protein